MTTLVSVNNPAAQARAVAREARRVSCQDDRQWVGVLSDVDVKQMMGKHSFHMVQR